VAIRNFKNSSIKTGVTRSTIWDQVSYPSVSAEVFIIAGGGGGGGYNAAGSGSGGAVYDSFQAIKNTSYTIAVGAGGNNNPNVGANAGSSSTFGNTITAYGGAVSQGEGWPGTSGGSGSGHAYPPGGNGGTATQGTGGDIRYGSAGGNMNGSTYTGGGGGGLGSAGGNSSGNAGNGGNGTTTYSTWLSDIASLMPSDWQTATANGYIGAGAGASYDPGTGASGPGSPGLGGAGNSGSRNSSRDSNFRGIAYTGSAAGAGGTNAAGNGGAGICIFRIPDTDSITSTTGSPYTKTINGYKYYVFIGAGSITI
jgi:hypothetical protein